MQQDLGRLYNCINISNTYPPSDSNVESPSVKTIHNTSVMFDPKVLETSDNTKNRHVYITAILPAHNEESGIAAALNSIRQHVDKIIVACDNCSDNTAEKAKQLGANVVFNTVNNHDRKAGALNQALKHYVDWHIHNQYLLIMDADTVVVNPKRWFSKATRLVYPNRPRLSRKARDMNVLKRNVLRMFNGSEYKRLFNGKAYDCVGSVFEAPRHLKHNTNIEECQRLEWEGYMAKVGRDRKVWVLTGTCSLISAEMLQKVYRHYGRFYDKNSITEDFEMTIALKEMGARMISPISNQCVTATKPHAKSLINQRKRWYLGAIDLVCKRSPDKVMLPYVGQQFMLLLSVFAFFLFIGVSIYLYLIGSVKLTYLWTSVFVVYDVAQVLRVWNYSNTFDKVYAATMIGVLYYSCLLDIAYVLAIDTYVDRKKMYWNHARQTKKRGHKNDRNFEYNAA